MDAKNLTPLRQAALTMLEQRGNILWSATTVAEAATLNWLVKNGYAKRDGWMYFPENKNAHIP